MPTYADTSFTLALYHPESASAAANACMARQSEPLILTAVQEAEFRNASRLRVARKNSTSEEVVRALAYFDRDIVSGIYAYVEPNWPEVFLLVERISQKHTERGAHRFADLLQVACALNVQANVFLSFDQRQSKLAKALGMKTPF